MDDFGSNLDLHPTHAWAPRGARAVASVPRTTPLPTTTMASISEPGLGPAVIVAGGVNRVTFTTYLEPVVAPTVRPGQVVLLDQLRAHQRARAAEVSAACGGRLIDLPPYAPDDAPIELACAPITADLRRAAARPREVREAAMAIAVAKIKAADAHAFSNMVGIDSL